MPIDKLKDLVKATFEDKEIEALNQKSKEAKNKILGIDLDLDKDVKKSSLQEELSSFLNGNHKTLEDELKQLSNNMNKLKQEKVYIYLNKFDKGQTI